MSKELTKSAEAFATLMGELFWKASHNRGLTYRIVFGVNADGTLMVAAELPDEKKEVHSNVTPDQGKDGADGPSRPA